MAQMDVVFYEGETQLMIINNSPAIPSVGESVAFTSGLGVFTVTRIAWVMALNTLQACIYLEREV
jgi:hypothetical protein